MGNLMSTIKANDIQNASGGIPTVKSQQLIPTAWVNFNGTGTVVIRGSEGISSAVDNGTGNYTFNFTTAMASVNYAITSIDSRDDSTSGGNRSIQGAFAVGTTSFSLSNVYDASTFDDGKLLIHVMGGQA